MSNHKPVSFKVLNKEFQVNCPAGTEEQLFETAHYLDRKIRGIRRSGRVIGLERLTIMAALNITHELLALRRQKEADLDSLNDQIKRLQNKIDGVFLENNLLIEEQLI